MESDFRMGHCHCRSTRRCLRSGAPNRDGNGFGARPAPMTSRSRPLGRTRSSARRAGAYSFRQRARVRRQSLAGVDRRGRSQDGLHRSGLTMGEWLRRELQRPDQGRAAGRRDIQFAAGGADHHRELAAALQRRSTAPVTRISPTSTGSILACACRVAVYAASIRSAGHAPSGVETNAKLTLLPDYSVGPIRLPKAGTFAGIDKP